LRQARERSGGLDVVPFTISGTGKQVRDVLHASDLVALYRAAYDHRQTVEGQIYNIGGGMENSLSLLELFELLAEKTGTQPVFNRLPRRQSDQNVFVADIRKAGRDLVWAPQTTASSGIDKMLEWVRESVV